MDYSNIGQGVYWIGQDGNTYMKAAGLDGVQKWVAPLKAPQDLGLTQIADPLAPANNGGGSGGGGSNGPTQSQINTSRDNTINAGQTQLSGKASEYDTNQQKWANQITDTQNTLNTNRANNALNLRRSMSSIAGGVRQGLRSGGVMLANMGASDSGAAQAMADAYAKEGNGLANDANNEFALKDQSINDQQLVLNRDRDQGFKDLQTWKVNETNKIKGSLAADLSTLASQASANGLGGVNPAVVDEMVNNALIAMANVDARTTQQLSGVGAWDANTVNQKAAEMDQAGAAGSNPFSTVGVDMLQPAGAGGSMQGAPITQIPIRYTRRNF